MRFSGSSTTIQSRRLNEFRFLFFSVVFSQTHTRPNRIVSTLQIFFFSVRNTAAAAAEKKTEKIERNLVSVSAIRNAIINH